MDQSEPERRAVIELIAALRAEAAAHEPVPQEVVEAARAAFAWRLIDAELAELVADSIFEPKLAGVRGDREPRILTFGVPGGTALELEATPIAGGLRLLGQIVPGRSGTAQVQHPGGEVDADVDGMGRFAAEDIPHGHVRIRLRLQPLGAGEGQDPVEIVTASLTL